MLATAPATGQQPPHPSDTDARIKFYKGRLGGPGTYPAYARLGVAYLQKADETGDLRDYDEAERYLRQSFEYQRNYEALLGLAGVSLAKHLFRQARDLAQEAANTMPADPQALGLLFDAYLALGETDKAEEALRRLQTGPMDLASSSRLAAWQEAQGNLDAALASMQKACAQAETRQAAAARRAWCAVRLGSLHLLHCQPGEAEAGYRRALELVPGYYLALEHLAELRAAQGDTEAAVALYHRLLARLWHPEYRVALADLYAQRRQPKPAARERQRALREMRRSLAAGSRAHVRPLAFLLLHDPRTRPEGLRLAEEEWEQRRDAFAADLLAWAYYQNDRDPEALSAIQQALRLRPRDPAVSLHAALIHTRLGRRDEGAALVNQLLSCALILSPADRTLAEKLRADLGRKTGS